ncbi:hypothetical protein [Breoghania sp. JC706]|uniref:hypothetical protein n=1 Tax=Breoghania sp. JC706 TaxID=3117732 RepID=UPI00300B416F
MSDQRIRKNAPQAWPASVVVILQTGSRLLISFRKQTGKYAFSVQPWRLAAGDCTCDCADGPSLEKHKSNPAGDARQRQSRSRIQGGAKAMRSEPLAGRWRRTTILALIALLLCAAAGFTLLPGGMTLEALSLFPSSLAPVPEAVGFPLAMIVLIFAVDAFQARIDRACGLAEDA